MTEEWLCLSTHPSDSVLVFDYSTAFTQKYVCTLWQEDKRAFSGVCLKGLLYKFSPALRGGFGWISIIPLVRSKANNCSQCCYKNSVHPLAWSFLSLSWQKVVKKKKKKCQPGRCWNVRSINSKSTVSAPDWWLGSDLLTRVFVRLPDPIVRYFN